MVIATVLVVDDEQTLRDTLDYNLRREGYQVLTAADGQEAVRIAIAQRPDLIILDLMLPGINGFEVCRVLRHTLTTPILMLSAREEEIDKVLGLELGADDYLTKPFGLRELLARVHALLRRTDGGRQDAPVPAAELADAVPAPGSPGASPAAEPGTPPTLVSGNLAIDLARRTVVQAGRLVSLAPKEFDLLAFLAGHPRQVFARDILLDRVWGYDFVGGTRTVDVHIHGLRARLEADAGNPALIVTVYGVGYKFEGPVLVHDAI